jgi:hypothetical protein
MFDTPDMIVPLTLSISPSKTAKLLTFFDEPGRDRQFTGKDQSVHGRCSSIYGKIPLTNRLVQGMATCLWKLFSQGDRIMIRFGALAALCGLLVLSSGMRAADKEEIDKAKKAVEKKMADLKAPDGGTTTVFEDEALAKLFPNHVFVGVRFRQFPVARLLPKGVSAFNLFAYEIQGLHTLSSVDELRKFFEGVLPAVKDDAAAKNAAHAWLLLAQEQQNDGFYKFKIMDDAIKVTAEKGGRKVSAQSMATSGGNGDVSVTMVFDEKGKLTTIEPGGKLKPGPRPICQATKLLDPDPIVRKMAEQDLLCMGRAAKAYLDEQRAKAGPELQKAIDRIWQRIVDEDR